MEEFKTLEQLSENASDNLLNAIEIFKILKTLTYETEDIEPLIRIIDEKIKCAFNDIEECRHIISHSD